MGGQYRVTLLFPHSMRYAAKDQPAGNGYQKSIPSIIEIERTHSFATGPVMAEPFISPFALTMTPALSYVRD
jgi:hypothetical protein